MNFKRVLSFTDAFNYRSEVHQMQKHQHYAIYMQNKEEHAVVTPFIVTRNWLALEQNCIYRESMTRL